MLRNLLLSFLFAGSVGAQELRSVMTWTNGVIARPTNFWAVNYTNLLPYLPANTNGLTYSFSSDFRVVDNTNVYLVASNLYQSIAALQAATNNVGTNYITATNTLFQQLTNWIFLSTNKVQTNVLATLTNHTTLATNTLFQSLTNYIGVSTNHVETNVLARLTTATNTVQTNVLQLMTNLVVAATNGLTSSFGAPGYSKTNIAISSGLVLNASHGLGRRPYVVTCTFLCTNDDVSAGYLVGDEISSEAVTDGDKQNVQYGANTSQIWVSENDNTIHTNHKTTGAKNTTMYPTNWNIVIRAW